MDYQLEKLRNASSFLSSLADDLESDSLSVEDKILKEADLVNHLERLLIISQLLRGVKVDYSKVQALVALI